MVDEEGALVEDLGGGKVPAVVAVLRPPLQDNQAMDQLVVEEEALETTTTTTAPLLARSSLVTEPPVVMEVSLR